MSVRRLVVAVLVAGWLVAPPAALASTEALRAELAAVAKSVKDLLEEEKRSSVAVGEFSGPAALDSQFGPGIGAVLAEELAKLGLTVDRKAELCVCGNYADDTTTVRGEPRLVMNINARVLKRNGDELHRIKTRVIRDNTTIAKAAGVTASLSPNGSALQRNEEIRRAIEAPSAVVRGAKVAARADSPFAVEVLVRAATGDTVARPAAVVDGHPFVGIGKDEVYELRLTNAADHEVAASVTVDGVDVFAFSEDRDPRTGKRRFSHFVLDPKSVTTVSGWHVTSDPKRRDNVLTFKVTELGRGAASAAGVTGKVGVVTVTFSACGKHPADLPADEPASRSGAGVETGFGPPKGQRFEAVSRTVGAVREVVSVRYAR